MDKSNIIRSSEFFMAVGDVLHYTLIVDSGVTPTISLVSVGDNANSEEVPDAVVAIAASDITSSSFTANWNFMENTSEYYLDVATDSAFTTMVVGYDNLSVGNINEYSVVGLNDTATYYYRVRGANWVGTGESSNTITTTTANEVITDADGNVYTYVTIGTQQWMVENFRSTKYADGTPIPNLTESEYDDWFLPSYDELQEIYNALVPALIPADDNWWCSSEFSATEAYYLNFITNTFGHTNKIGNDIDSYACRTFTAGVGDYSLGDTGEGGGWVFYINGTTYMEVSKTSNGVADNYHWSNIALLVGTGTAIGTGQANTTAIINQAGHTGSAAKLCNDLSAGGWVNDTTGAYCAYDNDVLNIPDYGLLYNWYAVDNAHGLAPAGWRVPSKADYVLLVTFLGGYAVAGGKMKEAGLTHWNAPNTGATNDYGLSILAGGERNDDGSFANILFNSLNYLSTETIPPLDGDCIILTRTSAEASEDNSMPKGAGCSVRMMRDVI